jgi:hypothetical protein
MNSTNDDPNEKNKAQEESEAIEQEHEVDAADYVKPVERTTRGVKRIKVTKPYQS